MSDGDGKGEEKFDMDFASFLNDYSGMFTVMGVFAALAIYLSRVTEDPIFEADLMIQLGFGAAFVIALVVMIEIYHVLKRQFGSWHRLIHAHFRLKNIDLAVFTLGILVISLTIYHILTRQAPVMFILMILAASGVALAVMLRVPYALAEVTPHSPIWRVSIAALFSGGALAVSHYAFVELNSRYTVTQIQDLTLNDPFGIILLIGIAFFGMVRSLASVGIVAVAFGIPIIIIDKIRGVSPYDQPD